MKYGIHTLDDYDVRGKTVIMRIDINQPVDRAGGRLKDTTRIEASVPTIAELSDRGARLVLLAHQGSDIEYENFASLDLHGGVLRGLLGRDVRFVDDVCGPAARAAILSLRDGEILLLDNVRFMAEEMTLFERRLNLDVPAMQRTQVVAKLAPLGDLFVCDAFAAAHRAQPTLMGFAGLLPVAMGRLFEREYSVLSALLESPEHPSVFCLGGAKIADAFMMMGKVCKDGVADQVLCGGLVGQVMLAAAGFDLGAVSAGYLRSKNLWEHVETAKHLLDSYGGKFVLPVDVAYVENGARVEIPVSELPAPSLLLDIGRRTAEQFSARIAAAKTVFLNGPVGVYEDEVTELGTKSVFGAVADAAAYTVVGGGDSISALNKYGLAKKISYVCTGGGAMVRFLTGEDLPVVEALKYGTEKIMKIKREAI